MLENLSIKPKEAFKTSEIDFKKIHSDTFVDVSEVLQRPPIALSFGKNHKDYDIPLVTYGNFMCIVGASKSMKTFLKSALLSSYISGPKNSFFNDIRGFKSRDKFVLDFDTEQGKYHAQMAFRRVVDMVGSNNEFYKPFALRGLSPKERLQFIEWCYYESEYRDNIGLSSIDGVADLVENVNDLDKSNELTQSLMKMTEKTNSAMITVLHRNFASQKPTGHLGSSILKKAETVLFVEREESHVRVKPEYTRNEPFEEFSFTLNDDYLPFQIGGF